MTRIAALCQRVRLGGDGCGEYRANRFNHRLTAQLDNEGIIANAPLSTAKLSRLQFGQLLQEPGTGNIALNQDL